MNPFRRLITIIFRDTDQSEVMVKSAKVEEYGQEMVRLAEDTIRKHKTGLHRGDPVHSYIHGLGKPND